MFVGSVLTFALCLQAMSSAGRTAGRPMAGRWLAGGWPMAGRWLTDG